MKLVDRSAGSLLKEIPYFEVIVLSVKRRGSEIFLTVSSAGSSSVLESRVFGPVALMKLIRSKRDLRRGLLFESRDHKESPPKLWRLSSLGNPMKKVYRTEVEVTRKQHTRLRNVHHDDDSTLR